MLTVYIQQSKNVGGCNSSEHINDAAKSCATNANSMVKLSEFPSVGANDLSILFKMLKSGFQEIVAEF